MKIHKLKTVLALLLFTAFHRPFSASATISVSDLSNTISGYFSVMGGTIIGFPPQPQVSCAQSFTTGTGSYTLQDVTLSLSGGSGGGFQVFIYTNSAGAPGNFSGRTSLSGNSSPNTAGLYTYNATNTLNLNASTTYWVVALDANSNAGYGWNETSDLSYAGLPGWSIGNYDSSFVLGGGISWGTPDGSSHFSLGVDISPVPEPGSGSLLVLAFSLLGWKRGR